MNNNGQKQVSLAGAAGNPVGKVKTKKKKQFPRKAVIAIVACLAVVLTVVLVVNGTKNDDKPALTAREMVTYTVTPDNISNNVSYYLLGVTGDKITDRLDMVSVMCYNRKKDTVSVLQMPVSTYVSKEAGYAVNALGDVWGNPQPVPFCSAHRTELTADVIVDGTHKGCGAKVEYRTGSSTEDMIRVINEQYGLPIDNYLFIPRAGLVQLIDALGGVDVKLDKKITLSGTTYEAGVQTLNGQAAVTYAVEYNYTGTAASDRERMLRQRQVFTALLQRIGSGKLADLYSVDKNTGSTKGAVGQLMLSANPIRFNTTSFGKERLLNISEAAANKMKLSEAMARFLYELGQVPLSQITCSILPGEKATSGSAAVYSVNRAKTLELLNTQMNPYGLTLDDTTVKVPQLLKKQNTTDTATATLDGYAQEQKGTVTTTTKATATTTTLAGMG